MNPLRNSEIESLFSISLPSSHISTDVRKRKTAESEDEVEEEEESQDDGEEGEEGAEDEVEFEFTCDGYDHSFLSFPPSTFFRFYENRRNANSAFYVRKLLFLFFY
jgi:hypothetical protein